MGEGILSLSFTEIVIIGVLAFLLLKPGEISGLGRWVGKMLRKLVSSDGWKVFQQVSREIRNLPNNLMREANKDEGARDKELRRAIDPRPATPPPPVVPRKDEDNNA